MSCQAVRDYICVDGLVDLQIYATRLSLASNQPLPRLGAFMNDFLGIPETPVSKIISERP